MSDVDRRNKRFAEIIASDHRIAACSRARPRLAEGPAPEAQSYRLALER
ncbi:hypothetical protein RVN83_36685 [Streptomyces sp. PU10]|nr:hypothetical protein [Streptomyces sp. PU10]MDA4888411.1 hypothetical protein [Streptomyces sp. MS2A]MDU0258464.1 hypothetical protein [Streptomyces sp. PU10]